MRQSLPVQNGSPRGFRQDQLVQRQIRNSTPEPLILLLKALQFFQLVYAHSAISLAPAVIRLFDNADAPDSAQTGQTFPHQNPNLPQLRDNLFRLGRLFAILDPPFPKRNGGPLHRGRIMHRMVPKCSHSGSVPFS